MDPVKKSSASQPSAAPKRKPSAEETAKELGEKGIKVAQDAFKSSSDELTAIAAAGVAQLVLARKANVKEFDAKLQSDFKGTVKAHVKNPVIRAGLLSLSERLGDKAASDLMAAGIGSLSETATELMKNAKYRKMAEADPQRFGRELLKQGGSDFGFEMLKSFGTAKLESFFGL